MAGRGSRHHTRSWFPGDWPRLGSLTCPMTTLGVGSGRVARLESLTSPILHAGHRFRMGCWIVAGLCSRLAGMDIRHARRTDHETIKSVLPAWWSDSRSPEEAHQLGLLLPPLFLQHFASTSWVAEIGGELAGFVIGFHSADHPDETYIHFTGVDPSRRGEGVARSLYERVFAQARDAGRTTARAITSPGNRGSIAFHTSVGFTVVAGDKRVDGVSVHSDYDGPGEDRVCFVARLAM